MMCDLTGSSMIHHVRISRIWPITDNTLKYLNFRNVFEFKVELEAPLPLCIAKEGGMAHAASIAKWTSLHDGQLP